MRKKIQLALIMLMVMVVLAPMTLHAAVVGRFTQVTGQVDLLKQGKIPGVPVKVQDGVETGDVIRTKSKSKAQVRMVDDSVITLAPDSRLAIADYSYNPTNGERRAVVRFFKGLVRTVVHRVIKTEEPDFIMETHTATIGVRGTDWFTLLTPNLSSVYLNKGLLGVSSNVPALRELVPLSSQQVMQIPLGSKPLPPKPMTSEMLPMLEKMMDTGVQEGSPLSGPTPQSGGPGPSFLTLPGAGPEQLLRQQTIPPVVQPPHLTPPTPVTPSQPSSPGSGGSNFQPGE